MTFDACTLQSPAAAGEPLLDDLGTHFMDVVSQLHSFFFLQSTKSVESEQGYDLQTVPSQSQWV